MKVFWFVYSTLMCAPAILAAGVFYMISRYGIYAFNEPIRVVRIAETICAFVLVLLAIIGWIIATIILFKKEEATPIRNKTGQ